MSPEFAKREPLHEDRLRSVARTYLAPSRSASIAVVVAGPDDPYPPRVTAEGLGVAAGRLGLGYRIEGQSNCLGAAPAPDEAAPLLLVLDHGAVDEARLGVLSGRPALARPDMLLWTLSSSKTLSRRALYLLGVWTWFLAPRALRCLLPPSCGQLEEARERTEQACPHAAVGIKPQVLAMGAEFGSEGCDGALRGLIQSALSAAGRAKASGGHG